VQPVRGAPRSGDDVAHLEVDHGIPVVAQVGEDRVAVLVELGARLGVEEEPPNCTGGATSWNGSPSSNHDSPNSFARAFHDPVGSADVNRRERRPAFACPLIAVVPGGCARPREPLPLRGGRRTHVRASRGCWPPGQSQRGSSPSIGVTSIAPAMAARWRRTSASARPPRSRAGVADHEDAASTLNRRNGIGVRGRSSTIARIHSSEYDARSVARRARQSADAWTLFGVGSGHSVAEGSECQGHPGLNERANGDLGRLTSSDDRQGLLEHLLVSARQQGVEHRLLAVEVDGRCGRPR